MQIHPRTERTTSWLHVTISFNMNISSVEHLRPQMKHGSLEGWQSFKLIEVYVNDRIAVKTITFHRLH